MNDIQNNQAASSAATIRIINWVAAPAALPLAELRRMDNVEIADLPLRCGAGEPKGRTGCCRGVLLALNSTRNGST